jgi:hypothetical protein
VENTPKVFKRFPRMRKKLLSGDFKGFCIYDIVSEYAETILTCTENTQKVYKRKREYARSILPYVENTPTDIKFSLCRQIFDQTQKNLILNHLPRHDRMRKKPSQAILSL